MREFDKDRSNSLNFDEFCNFILTLVEHKRSGKLTHVAVDPAGVCEDDEEEEMPEDLCHLTPKQQRHRIIMRAFTMMIAGTLLVILFSDPIVDLLDVFGTRTHINSFYISFILAPLISNLSEIIASFNYAAKQTIKASTISICTLQGSAIMNNTVCFNDILGQSFSGRTVGGIIASIVGGILAGAGVLSGNVPLALAGVGIMSLGGRNCRL